jgi:BRCT domain type II-containing protein
MLDLPILNKIFDLQISVIKSAKIQSLLQGNAGQLSDTDAKSAESANKKREKHWLMLKHSEDLLKQLEASEKNYWHRTQF